MPTTSPIDVVQMVLTGNYIEIIGDNKTQFLKECTDAYQDVICTDVIPGSIILDLAGPSDKLKQAEFSIMSEGLWLPSFPVLHLGTRGEEAKVDNDSEDLFEPWHIIAMGIGLPCLCLLVSLIFYYGRGSKKSDEPLLDDDFVTANDPIGRTRTSTTFSRLSSRTFTGGYVDTQPENYVVLVD